MGSMRRATAIGAVVLVTAISVAACGSSGTPTSELAPIAAAYSAIAARGDAAVVQCNRERVAAQGGTLAKAKTVAADCLASTSGYVAELKAVNWGPVEPQADKVIATIVRIDALFAQMANASDAAAFRIAYEETGAAVGDLLVFGTALREALGLPPGQF